MERIKRNSEDWELDKGNESGIKFNFDCVRSFMEIDACYKLSNKYGLDTEIVASFRESFATHVDLPKEKWMIFKPLLLREINMSSKLFTKGSYYLRVKSIFSAELMKSIGGHKRFNTIEIKYYT